MSLIFAKTILLICMAKIGQGYMQTLVSSFSTYSRDVQYTVPPTSYFILDWMFSGSYGHEGFISKYTINFISPVNDITLKFQVWGKSNTSNRFIFKGENVFNNVKGEGYTYLYPKDVDQITIRSTDIVGLYVDEYSNIPYTLDSCHQPLRVYNATSPMIGQTYDFAEYTTEDVQSCMSFALSVGIIEMDLSCNILEINNINNGDLFTMDSLTTSGPQKQCWVVRMMRPCTSSINSSLSPSVKVVQSKMYNCDYQKLEIHDGGTARDESIGSICGLQDLLGISYTGNSYVLYMEYTAEFAFLNAYEEPFKLKYFFNFDHYYLPEYLEYCEGEFKPETESKNDIISSTLMIEKNEEETKSKHSIFSTTTIIRMAVSCGVLFFVAISFSIGGIVAYKRGKNPRTPAFQSTPATISGAPAAHGLNQQTVNGIGLGEATVKYHQGDPTVAYQAPIYQVPEPGRYPQQHPQPPPGHQRYLRQPYPQQFTPMQGYPQQFNTTQMYPLQPNLHQAYSPQPALNDVPPPTYDSVITQPPVVD